MAQAEFQAFSGSALLVGDDEHPPLLDSAVVLDDGGRIVFVGPRTIVGERFPQVAIRTLDAVISPGLVNAHCHLELSSLRGKVPGGRGFVAWMEALLAQRAIAAPELDAEAIDSGVAALLSTGTVAVGEVTNSLASLESLATAPLLARVFHEVYGVGRESAFACLDRAVAARKVLGELPSNVSYVVSPHTPYSMHPDLLREVMQRAVSRGERVSIHVAEHAAERAFMMDGSGPLADFLRKVGRYGDWHAPARSSIDYLEGLSMLTPEVIVVHLTDARHDELARVAAMGCPVVLCPRSNLHIEVRLPPLLELLSLGVRPALGTDSLASSPNLDVLGEAKALHARFPTVAPRTLLAMAMGHGADALGLAHRVGRMRVGLAPGLIAWNHGSRAPEDPESFVLQFPDKTPREILSRPSLRMDDAP